MSEFYSLNLPDLLSGGKTDDLPGVFCRLTEPGRGIRLLMLDLAGSPSEIIFYKLVPGLPEGCSLILLPAAADDGLVFVSGADKYVSNGARCLLINDPDMECSLMLEAGCSARLLLMFMAYSRMEPYNNGRFKNPVNRAWGLASGLESGILEIDCSDMGFVPAMEKLILNEAPDWISRLESEADAFNLVQYLFSRCFASPDSDVPEELLAVKDLLLSNLDRRVPLSELTGLAGWSEERLLNEFSKAYGLSVKEFIIRERMAYAAELLENGRASVLDISMAAGYASQSAFAGMFRRYYGMSPTAYRRCYAKK